MPGVDGFGAQGSEQSDGDTDDDHRGVRKPPRSSFPSGICSIIRSHEGRTTVGSKSQALHVPEAEKPSIA
jgi:hypothetical protein